MIDFQTTFLWTVLATANTTYAGRLFNQEPPEQDVSDPFIIWTLEWMKDYDLAGNNSEYKLQVNVHAKNPIRNDALKTMLANFLPQGKASNTYTLATNTTENGTYYSASNVIFYVDSEWQGITKERSEGDTIYTATWIIRQY